VPQPSNDPNDPLNWSYTKKVVVLLAAGIFTGVSTWIIGGLNSALPALKEEFDVELPALIDAIANWGVLMLGVGVQLVSLCR
jgi:hypothetical protein